MTKDFKIILIVGAILISAVYVMLYSPLSNTLFSAKNGQVTIKNTIPKYKDLESLKKLKDKAKQSTESVGSLKDPFSVPFAFEKVEITGETTATVEAVKLNVLQAIIIQTNGRPTAIIDDKMLYEGQKIYNWKVTKILPDKVILTRGKRTKTLKLKLGVE